MIVIACPGQGSQTPGFLHEWLELPNSRSFLAEASERAGTDLVKHGTISDAETIRDTRIAQPLIVAASLLAWQALAENTPLDAVGVAGHSVGEFTAAAAAGVLSANDAIQLVGVRSQAMASASAQADTGMLAVIGGVEEEVLAKITEHGLTPANLNGGGQIVAAGAREALQAFAGDALRGVRVIPLQVAGAFHTKYMASAVPVLAEAAKKVMVSDPTLMLWTNADGSRVVNGSRFLELLVSQITQPVRWNDCMTSFKHEKITGFIELCPAGALSGIAKRALPGTPIVAVKSPSDLDAAITLIEDAA